MSNMKKFKNISITAALLFASISSFAQEVKDKVIFDNMPGELVQALKSPVLEEFTPNAINKKTFVLKGMKKCDDQDKVRELYGVYEFNEDTAPTYILKGAENIEWSYMNIVNYMFNKKASAVETLASITKNLERGPEYAKFYEGYFKNTAFINSASFGTLTGPGAITKEQLDYYFYLDKMPICEAVTNKAKLDTLVTKNYEFGNNLKAAYAKMSELTALLRANSPVRAVAYSKSVDFYSFQVETYTEDLFISIELLAEDLPRKTEGAVDWSKSSASFTVMVTKEPLKK